MANWTVLKAAVANIIKTNGNQEITGRILQNALSNIISTVGENATMAGIATPDTNPGAPDGPIFYIATQPGNYSNFDGLTVNSGEFVIFTYNGNWKKQVVDIYVKANNIIVETDKLGDFLVKQEKRILALNKDSYTNVAKNIGAKNQLAETYKAIPTERRGIGALFSDQNNEYARFRIVFQSSKSNYEGTFKIKIDGTEYKVPITYGQSIESIVEAFSKLTFPNYTCRKNGVNYVDFVRTTTGVAKVEPYNLTTYQLRKNKATFTEVEGHKGGTIKIYNNGNVSNVNVTSEDDLASIIKKIMLVVLQDLGSEQIGDNVIEFTDYNVRSSTNRSFSINGGGIVTVSVEEVQPFKAKTINLNVLLYNNSKMGNSSTRNVIFHQIVNGNGNYIGENANYISQILETADETRIKNTIFGKVPTEAERNVIPADYRSKNQLFFRTEQNVENTELKSIRRFIGSDVSTQWTNFSYWEEMGAHIKQLEFDGGCCEWTPIKDAYGNYIKGHKWVLNVLKELDANVVGYVSGNNNPTSYAQIIIPKGEYEVNAEFVIGNAIWWNNKMKKIEFGVPSSYVDCYLMFRIWENYIELKNIKAIDFNSSYNARSFRGIVQVKQFNRTRVDAVGLNYPDVSGKIINVTKVLPDDFEGDWLSYLDSTFYSAENWYFPEGEYKANGLPVEARISVNKVREINIGGAGVDKTIFKNWDFSTNEEKAETYLNYFNGVNYKNCTIYNRGFGHYGGDGKQADGHGAAFENVKIKFTKPIPGGYIFYILSIGFTLSLKNVTIEQIDCKTDTFAGIWVGGPCNLEIDNVTVGNQITKPFVSQGAGKVHLNGLHTIDGQTGIFFGANKNRPLDGAVIENCIAEGASEECLSFDTYGNNVDLNPTIAELSIKEAVIEYVGNRTYYNKRMKIYCDARNLTGSYYNEQYNSYSFDGNEEYLEQFYVYFSQLAGDTFAGTVAKIIEVGKDDTKGQFLIINTQLDPFKLTLLEDKSISSSDNSNYQVASILSGFFNLTVRNNIVRRGLATGLALYCSVMNSVIEGNKVENCRGGSYMYSARVLAKPVWNPCTGNIIVNNKFEGGDEKAFRFISFGGILAYNVIFANNLILNSKGIGIEKQRNLLYQNNLVTGDEAEFLLNDVESSSFGKKLPQAPYPGQRFFDMEEKVEKIWDGENWV